jgi:hypothetical protein
MPTQRYNGRYLGTGNGGYAGGFFQSELAAGINNGFAAANTDMAPRLPTASAPTPSSAIPRSGRTSAGAPRIS